MGAHSEDVVDDAQAAAGSDANIENDDHVPALFEPEETDADEGFGAEFRKLARQRRFARTAAQQADREAPDAGLPAVEALLASARQAARLTQPASQAASAPDQARSAPSPREQRDTRQPARRSSPAPTVDQTAAIVELARLAERVVDARERLVAERGRADRAEAELTVLRDRMLAARGLVHDAQKASQQAAERAAWLEGRCVALEASLDKALAASWLHRWRWRRALKATGDGFDW